jgi:hypothetical protein
MVWPEARQKQHYPGQYNAPISFPSQRFKSISKIPVKVYAKTFVNSGYIYNTTTKKRFNQQLIYSGGIDLDVVTPMTLLLK